VEVVRRKIILNLRENMVGLMVLTQTLVLVNMCKNSSSTAVEMPLQNSSVVEILNRLKE
jgi:hypothetical protein